MVELVARARPFQEDAVGGEIQEASPAEGHRSGGGQQEPQREVLDQIDTARPEQQPESESRREREGEPQLLTGKPRQVKGVGTSREQVNGIPDLQEEDQPEDTTNGDRPQVPERPPQLPAFPAFLCLVFLCLAGRPEAAEEGS